MADRRPRRKPRRKRSEGLRWVPLGFVAVALLAAGLYFGGAGDWLRDRAVTNEPGRRALAPESSVRPRDQNQPDRARSPAQSSPAEAAAGDSKDFSVDSAGDASGDRAIDSKTAPAATEAQLTSPVPRPGKPARVAVVIDDLGRSLRDLRRLEALGIPLTYAVLPFETLTAEVVRELAAADREVLLHLPMEPANAANPGPGALISSMSPKELAALTQRALDAVPTAVGVNNHMGSRMSTDSESMQTILTVIGRRRLFFLDSRTSAASVGYSTAIDLGLPAAERQIFLDGDLSPEAIRAQFRRLLEVASSQGSAIAIGHPYPETLAVLAQEVPASVELGFQFVPVSYLLDRPGVLPER